MGKIIQDRIYGTIEISNPAVLELLEAPSMKRLKGVEQHGHFEPHFPGISFSRFEHSVGVFILLKKFNAPLLEQASGLLHDISHTVFSHVADYVFSSGSGERHNFQDDCMDDFIKKTEVPEILKKHSIGCKEILDDLKHPLKERNLPDLCADRIDYFLRETRVTNKASQEEINKFLNNFVIIDNLWVFKSGKLAKKYAYLFLEINDLFWSGLAAAVMFKTTGELIKYVIEKNIITKDDLFTTEEAVWNKIRPKAEHDEKLKLLLDRADNKFMYKASDKNDYDLHTFCKSRVVDPLFLEERKMKRVSEVDCKFLELKEKKSKPKEYYIKFLERRI